MLREFFVEGNAASRLWALVGLLSFVGHQLFKAYLSYQLNGWYERFYDNLQNSAEQVLSNATASGEGKVGEARLQQMQATVEAQLLEFVVLVCPAFAVHPIASLIRNLWVYTWRRALMLSYLDRWNLAKPAIEGASQRIHEDTARFASGLQECATVLLHSILTLVVFLPVLVGIDGTLAGFASGAAVAGLLVSVLVGWPLVQLEVNNQVVEAELRKQLVLLETKSGDGDRALQYGDSSCEPRVGARFRPIVKELTHNYTKLYVAFTALTAWLSLHEQFASLLPYAAAAPRVFALDAEKRFTLGQLVKIANAFGRVFDSLNVVSDRWASINEWRSCLRRLSQFERELQKSDMSTPEARNARSAGQEVVIALDEPL